jgi:hypothetical protein
MADTIKKIEADFPGFKVFFSVAAGKRHYRVSHAGMRTSVRIMTLGGVRNVCANFAQDRNNSSYWRPVEAAACPRCGGWTSFGGMSQHSKGPSGCKCY